MVKVRTLQSCFIGNCLRAAGQVFEYTGEINPGVLVAIEDEAPVEKPQKSKVQRVPKTLPKIDE